MPDGSQMTPFFRKAVQKRKSKLSGDENVGPCVFGCLFWMLFLGVSFFIASLFKDIDPDCIGGISGYVLLVIPLLGFLKCIKKQKEKYVESYIEKRKKLMETDGYTYVKNFAKQYGVREEYISKLRILLSRKGFNFDDKQVRWLIEDEIMEQDYNKFKMKILANEPNTLEDYIQSFVNAYEMDDERNIYYF